MWKDFLYFSRGQRLGILFLLLVIVAAFAGFFFINSLSTTTDDFEADKFLLEAQQFDASLVSRDSLRVRAWREKWQRQFNDTTKSRFGKKKPVQYSLFPFDPNTADSLTFIKLGLKSFVASNILKYRTKGGKYKTPESFSKVWGIAPAKFDELKPYIRITLDTTQKKVVAKSFKTNLKDSSIVVELNTADTTQLLQVPGIGRGYAMAIVRFRQQIGGFVNIIQLKEIVGMTDANFQKMSPHCRIDLQHVRKINVNTASVERLNAHPYLNFYQSKAIYEFRRRKGKLKSIDELTKIDELDVASFNKISPYLKLE